MGSGLHIAGEKAKAGRKSECSVMSGCGVVMAPYPSDTNTSQQVRGVTTSQTVTTQNQNTERESAGNPTKQAENIGSIITMLISEQSLDLDEYLSYQVIRQDQKDEEMLLQAEVKEETLCETVLTHSQQQQQDYQQQQPLQQQPCQSQYYNSKNFQYFRSRSPSYDWEKKKLLNSYQVPPCSLPSYSTIANTRLEYSSPLGDRANLNNKRQLELETMPASKNFFDRKRDEKYWERRRKNNLAAKKSRDSRRVRENQLRLRVLCLENANRALREQMNSKEGEVVHLRDRLNKYENLKMNPLFCE